MAFDPLTAVLNIGNAIIDRLLPDKQANDAAKSALLQMQVQGELAQISGQLEIDRTEASNVNVFVAGWRPAIGWICGLALASDFILRPLLTWGAALFGHPIAYPPLDLTELLPLLMGMLGFGAMRSFDKTQGAASGH